MANYDEATAIRSLSKKKGVKISSGIIKIEKGTAELGNGSWGKISFLVNYCGYKQIFVDAEDEVFSTSNKKRKYDDDDNVKQHKPKAKERLSLAKLSKKIMK